MCLRVTRKYGCGHETSGKAPCATSRIGPCSVNNAKTVKHEELCDTCDSAPSSIWNLKEAPGSYPVESYQWSKSKPEIQTWPRGDGVGEGNGKEKETGGSMGDDRERTSPVKARKADGKPRDNGGLTFITGVSLADFKSKGQMSAVRKKAMESFLKGDSAKISRMSVKSRLGLALIPEKPADLDFEDSELPELSKNSLLRPPMRTDSQSPELSSVTESPNMIYNVNVPVQKEQSIQWVERLRIELSAQEKTQPQVIPGNCFEPLSLDSNPPAEFESQEQTGAWAPGDGEPCPYLSVCSFV